MTHLVYQTVSRHNNFRGEHTGLPVGPPDTTQCPGD